MDDTIQPHDEVRRLNEIIASMDKSAMMLVHRDLELRRVNQKLSELEHRKSEFVTIVAHQMRTPLSAILWSQQMLRSEEIGALTEAQQQIIDQTLASVNGLVALVNNLLTADHLELGKGNNETKRVNVAMAINEVVGHLFPIAAEKGIEMKFPEADAQVCTDINPDRARDVFQNLIDNAIKYTPESGRITIGMTVTDVITVTIRDTGIGIPADYERKLFGRFARADNAKRVDPNGSGLGLYIVKSIVEANGGTIQYEPTPGGGTTFIVTLQKAHDQPSYE